LCKRKSSRYSSPEDIQDITQEVLIKLLKNPPKQKPQKSAEVTVRAWLKKTTVNLHIDKWRKDSCKEKGSEERRIRRVDVEVDANVDASGDKTPKDIKRLEAVDELSDIVRYLENLYPKGSILIKTMKNNPDSTSGELSEIMGISPDNYYQMIKRTKLALSDYERVRRLAGGQE
jgi:RNA polymerase sigma factor (sigma-70 family)